MNKPLITLTSDFGIQTQGVGAMEAVALGICPDASVVHLMHGLPNFDIVSGARAMETITTIPIGYHVCVIDPGVGTKQKRIIIKTKRGDYLIGPDNGVLMSVTNILGFEKAVEITNKKYMNFPVSPIFHGRDIFTPAAAYLANGIKIEEFGPELKYNDLTKAPYEEAKIIKNKIHAQVIHINKFGSIHFNILHTIWDKLNIEKYQIIKLDFNTKSVNIPYVETFGDVDKNNALIMKDDYGRIEAAINKGNFSKIHNISMNDKCIISKE